MGDQINGGCVVADIGDDCTKDEDCSLINGDATCDVGDTDKCICNDGSIEDQINGGCVAVALGDACSDNADCSQISDAVCGTDSKCTCNTGYVEDGSGSCTANTLGGECTDDDDCSKVDNSMCDPDGANVCVCRPGYPEKDGQCQTASLGDSCIIDDDCSLIPDDGNAICSVDTGLCECNTGYKIEGAGCTARELQDSCAAVEDCAVIGNAICDSGFCECNNGYIEDGSGSCKPNELGGYCDDMDDCAYISNSMCDVNTCVCDPNFKENVAGTSCVPREIGDSCTDDGDCNNIGSAICDNGFCACTATWESDSNGGCIKIGGCGDTCATVNRQEGESCGVDSSTCSCNCACDIGYVDGNRGCEKALSFYGKMAFSSYEDDKKEEVMQYTEDVLSVVYQNTDGFKQAVALDYLPLVTRASVSAEVPYSILFDTEAEVEETVITETFEEEIATAVEDVEPPPIITVPDAPMIVVEESKATAVVPPTTEELCELDGASVCNATTSTCAVLEGTASTYCECKENYYQMEGTTTQCIAQFCSGNGDCNGPFGICDKSSTIYTCKCVWGLTGQNCTDPWLLVAVVLACFFGVCFLVTMVICLVRQPRKQLNKEKNKKGKPAVYEDSVAGSEGSYNLEERRAREYSVGVVGEYSVGVGYTNHALDDEVDEDEFYTPPVTGIGARTYDPSSQKYSVNHLENVQATGQSYDNAAFDDPAMPQSSGQSRGRSDRSPARRDHSRTAVNVSPNRNASRYQSTRNERTQF